MKNILHKFLLILIVGLFFGLHNGNTLAAVDCLEIKNAEGLIVHNGVNQIYVENNIYPGWSKAHKFTVKNKCKETANVSMKFSLKNDEGFLSKMMQVAVIQDNNKIISGYTLNDLDNKDLELGTVVGGAASEYSLEITFDKNAGNEYQGKISYFDIIYRLDEKVSSDTTEGNNPDDSTEKKHGHKKKHKKHKKHKKQKNANAEESFLTSFASGSFWSGDTYNDKDTQDDNRQIIVSKNQNSKEDGNIQVAGVRDIRGAKNCQGGLPLWIWIISLILGMAGVYMFGKTKKMAVNLIGQVVSISAVAILWYYFDSCREFIWVPWVDIIGGGLIMLLFKGRRA